MKYFFPIHLDGDNRGCEAIAKGTALIIGEKKENLYGLCRNIQLDTRLGIDNYYTLIPQNLSLKDRIKDSLTSKYWYFCCQRKPQFLRIEQKLNTIEQVLNIYRE